MNYTDAITRLQEHANPAGKINGHPHSDRSFVYALHCADISNKRIDTKPHIKEILECLAVIEEAHNPQTEDYITRELPYEVHYAISGILVAGFNYTNRWQSQNKFERETRDSIIDQMREVALAWDNVLTTSVDLTQVETFPINPFVPKVQEFVLQ